MLLRDHARPVAIEHAAPSGAWAVLSQPVTIDMALRWSLMQPCQSLRSSICELTTRKVPFLLRHATFVFRARWRCFGR